jgi:preprotein translocase subunit SecA
MRHIDAMSRLREEVAFEWYAQKQPLVVYKTKAYSKFEDLLWELEHKITKIIFALDKNENVEQIIEVKQNTNPLFASPIEIEKSQNRRPPSKKNKNKNKIRV